MLCDIFVSIGIKQRCVKTTLIKEKYRFAKLKAIKVIVSQRTAQESLDV